MTIGASESETTRIFGAGSFRFFLLPLAAGTLLAAAMMLGCKKDPQQAFQDGMEAYVKEDYKTALENWRPLADAGEASAQTNLGLMYSQGKGVPQDYKQALDWYNKAAMQNYPDAEYNLALLYRDGKGMAPNPEEAIRWFQYAAESGHLRAAVLLGDIYRKGAGVPANPREAAKWFEFAAEKGQPQAQVELGEMLAEGEGVAMDRIRAYLWFSAAAAQDADEMARARAGMRRMKLMSQMDDVEMAEGERQAENWREAKRTEANR